MPADAQKIRVLIATTNGAVEVLLLTQEDAAIGRSVACIGGTTDIADIASSYNAFVARPTGIVESLFGHACYRLDVSGPIDAGSSWQLGVLVAHALYAAGRLAQEHEPADAVIWATGSVRPVDLTVGSVGHIPEKFASSMSRLRGEAAAGRRVLVAIPAQNASAIPVDARADLAANGIEVIELSHVQSLWDRLAVLLPGKLRKAAGDARARAPRQLSILPRKRLTWAAAAAALIAVASAGTYWLVERPAVDAGRGQRPVQQPVAKAEVLVPELVPFVSARNRALIDSVYLPAPDHKALALSSHYMGFSTAQPDDETATAAALASCQRATDEAHTRSRCELHAVGNVVVSSRGRPPMPPQPWVVRDPTIERPFASTDVPFVSETSRQTIEREYPKARKSKALAVSAIGFYNFYANEASIDEAVRRALERCGSNAGVACRIIALDDVFVVPIPRTLKIIGFSQPGMINAVAPELREDVARRLVNATSGWNAVAVGASGRVGTKLGAASEQAAIDAAKEDCSRHDRECRVAIIGPFLVESLPAPPPATATTINSPTPNPPAPNSPGSNSPGLQPDGAETFRALVAALTSATPGLSASEHESLARRYQATKGHKVLAVVPGTALRWRTGDWPDAEAAEEKGLERCQAFHAKPCALVAVDDHVQTAPADGKWPTRDMSRLHYAGTFDPELVPGVGQRIRTRSDVVAYRSAAGPKAAAFHPQGLLVIVSTAESQHSAEVLALSTCNADPLRQEGPCHLYASGDRVVLPQRRTDPVTP